MLLINSMGSLLRPIYISSVNLSKLEAVMHSLQVVFNLQMIQFFYGQIH